MNVRALTVSLAVAMVVGCGPDAANRTPSIAGAPVTTAEDTAVSVTFTASDPDGDALTFRYSSPAHGALASAGPMITYTPAANYAGTDTITATVGDGELLASAVVAITITPVNDAPVATDDTVAGAEDTATTVPAAALTANDADLDGDALAVTAVSAADHGAVALAGGVVTFTPAADFIGEASFEYTLSDGTATDTGRVAVTVADANDAPVAVDDAGTTAEDAPLAIPAATLTANDTDAEGQTLAVTAVDAAVNGTVALAAGAITFTPTPDFAGAASFAYTVSDGVATDTAVVTVTVTPVNDPPVAVDDDAGATAEDTELVVAAAVLTANDLDLDGPALTVTAVGSPVGGTVALAAGSITFTPTPNLTGAAGFAYTVSDGALTDLGQVTLTVTPVADPPLAGDDTAVTAEDTALVIPGAVLTGNDTDVDGPALIVTAVGSPVHGTISLVAGVATFAPDPNYSGPAEFAYTVSDGALTDTGLVTITVTPVADAPVAADDAGTTAEDTPLTIVAATLAGNDTDGDDQALTVTAVGNPVNGAVVLAAGTITFTPAGDFTGAAGFEYVVTDGGLTDVGLVVVAVTPVNDPPAVAAQAVTTDENAAVVITLTAVDLDSPTVTFATSAPTAGALGPIAVTGPTTATVTYTPVTGATGIASFTVTADDGAAASAPATITVTIVDVAVCGDGELDPGEQCDDLNRVGLDGCSGTCRTETLFFSEYLEGSSNNKAIEIMNPLPTPVSLVGCSLRVYSNGAATPSSSVTLSATVAAHDVYVACNPGVTASVLAACDLPSNSFNWNGNDGVELFCTGATVDMLGRVPENPGTEWGLGLTSTSDNTLRRKCTVTSGDTTIGDGFNPATEWDGFATDTFAGLGGYQCP